ncbi:hypothetical protein Hanom_Chr08g00748331 [Helianthus anomalus]
MILDERYPMLVKGLNYINLKPMGPGCFENTCRNKRAKHHNFEARYALEKYQRFAENVQGAPVAPATPVIPVAPVPPPINAQIAEEHDIQHMQQVHQATDDEDEVLLVNSGSETDWSEETDSESEVEIVMSDKEEDAVRQPVPMTSENLTALLQSLQGGDGIPPSVSTTEVQETTADITKESAQKKQRTDTAPDDTLSGPATAPESTHIIDPQPDPPTTDASKKTNLEDPYLYDFNFYFETTPTQPCSSSGGVHFEAGSSSGAHTTEHDEAAFGYASEKRQVFESDNLKSAQIVSLQQDVALKEAHISSLQSQITNRDLTIDQLLGDVGLLVSAVYDLKAKLEKKLGSEFQTQEQRVAAHAAAEAERAVALEAYLAAKPKKRSSKSKKRRQEKELEKEQDQQRKKQLLVMKNQDMNPLDENF